MPIRSAIALATFALALSACPRAGDVAADPTKPSKPASVASTWQTSSVKLTWIVDDHSAGAVIRMLRALVVRIGTDERRYEFGRTQAGCGLFPDRPTIANPVPVGQEVTRLKCWLGGGDDLVVTRIAPDRLSVTNEGSSDGYDAPPPVAVSVAPPIPIPADAVFEDGVVFLDHGRPPDAGP